MTNRGSIRNAAHTLRDPSTPITMHVADLLDAVAGQCADRDMLGNCGTCPTAAAASALAEYVNAGTLVGAR